MTELDRRDETYWSTRVAAAIAVGLSTIVGLLVAGAGLVSHRLLGQPGAHLPEDHRPDRCLCGRAWPCPVADELFDGYARIDDDAIERWLR